MASKKDMRRADLGTLLCPCLPPIDLPSTTFASANPPANTSPVIPYQAPKPKETQELSSTLSSTLPMAVMLTRNRFIGWYENYPQPFSNPTCRRISSKPLLSPQLLRYQDMAPPYESIKKLTRRCTGLPSSTASRTGLARAKIRRRPPPLQATSTLPCPSFPFSSPTCPSSCLLSWPLPPLALRQPLLFLCNKRLVRSCSRR
ncbi:uncharacterized protein VDAG_02465 [Verticillium dahliae VdLs.17]|uniref:Uncharacterized protein n=1 Tax=Verticillium dahliae (strain VdLs.17 / ATCC MYA-4575 / FGSC 10137) TaxID=498257 RepID=G2WXY3_VERDV|nr:uncharacterized protein VDAG_02465 [Verticillium dahliae VdLs.17]EGY20941.1 hypothetical protein VDAG_02465 [Verticillium dahliae VdLs.17]